MLFHSKQIDFGFIISLSLYSEASKTACIVISLYKIARFFLFLGQFHFVSLILISQKGYAEQIQAGNAAFPNLMGVSPR